MKKYFLYRVTCVLTWFILFSCESDLGGLDGATGAGGSMARFAFNGNYLYTVDDESLNVYQVESNGSLFKINDVNIDFGIETIFATEGELFIGSNNAMYIYDITNGAVPVFLSAYSHVLSCDPVVVSDTLAFVTLRTSQCRANTINSLDVINVKNLSSPQLIGSYAMDSPYGLGLLGNMLFVCNGSNGVTAFDFSNPNNLSIKSQHRNVIAYDVIIRNNILIFTGINGVVQYTYEGNKLIELSTIAALTP